MQLEHVCLRWVYETAPACFCVIRSFYVPVYGQIVFLSQRRLVAASLRPVHVSCTGCYTHFRFLNLLSQLCSAVILK